MTTKQISVFLENKPGQLIEFTRLLQEHKINMHAMCLADTKDFGILRVIVDDSYKAACVLKEAGFVFSITPVLTVEIPDEPGALVRAFEPLAAENVNLEYTYAFTSRKEGSAYMILRVTDNEKAAEILGRNGIRLICQHDLAEVFKR